jgi:hypothetical protein
MGIRRAVSRKKSAHVVCVQVCIVVTFVEPACKMILSQDWKNHLRKLRKEDWLWSSELKRTRISWHNTEFQQPHKPVELIEVPIVGIEPCQPECYETEGKNEIIETIVEWAVNRFTHFVFSQMINRLSGAESLKARVLRSGWCCDVTNSVRSHLWWRLNGYHQQEQFKRTPQDRRKE